MANIGKYRLGKLTELHDESLIYRVIEYLESMFYIRILIPLSWYNIVGLQMHVLDRL